MGEILFLPHRLPYPPDRGDRIRSWHVLQALAKLAPVHVIAPNDDPVRDADRAAVESVAASLVVHVRQRSKVAAMAYAVMRGTPASVELFRDADVQSAVAKRLACGTIDTIYAYSGQMAAYVPRDFAGRFVMDFVDMDSAKFAAGNWGERFEARRLRAWEIVTARRADVSLFVSAAEQALFKCEAGLRGNVLENGIDLDRFDLGLAFDRPEEAARIVFTGQMDYAPNIAAVTDFVRDALPHIRQRVPDADFAIVGRAPTAAVRALTGEGVIVTGEVPDTRPWLAAADVVVAPLRLARGVQNKVLEAMAMGKAVVASPQAAEGIDAVAGCHLQVAADPVDAVVALLQNAAARAAMGSAARERMVARYGWEAVMAPLAGFVGQ
ncbi:MAG: TIGR03087 family PEP-CTERM/XrtA system glycosyltransferase [Sphingomonadaceae bacterium]